MQDFNMVGFAVEDLCSSQTAYTLVYNCNEYLRKDYKLNLSIFYQEQWFPSLKPEFAQYHIAEAVAFSGHLIATSVNTAFSIKNATRSKRYYYIYDLENLRPSCNQEYWDLVMNDDQIVKFTRSEDYLEYLRLAGYDVNPVVVPSFDIDKILEIINA
jgi:hypothetical protein